MSLEATGAGSNVLVVSNVAMSLDATVLTLERCFFIKRLGKNKGVAHSGARF
jgi:hypothetical protein